ncbi:MAG: NAD(P)H-dependent oxidoreductase [Acidobacteriota bacterium]|nr:NAD(P)H-dependent oxidoreductase [Acidobacteriota bacterium]
MTAHPDAARVEPVLAVCASHKGGAAHPSRSAVRSLLTVAVDEVARVYPAIEILDLRDHPLPLFDGRTLNDVASPGVDEAARRVGEAKALLFGIPAYWSAVSGGFKNFIEVLCGPAYDLAPPYATPFVGKPVGILVVGADIASASRGVAQALDIVEHIGAVPVGEPVSIADPRRIPSMDRYVTRLVGLLGLLAQKACGLDGRSASRTDA